MINKGDDGGEQADRSNAGSNNGVDSTVRDLTSSAFPGASVADTPGGKLDEDLLVCGGCRSRLMYPADCEEQTPDHWHVEMRCPNCGVREWAGFDLHRLDALDRELDRAEAEIEADLARLTRANMADYVNRFVSALDADAIEPDDFMR